jgi:hypothetical protein
MYWKMSVPRDFFCQLSRAQLLVEILDFSRRVPFVLFCRLNVSRCRLDIRAVKQRRECG